MSKSSPTKRRKKTVHGELGAIHQWMKDHEKHDNSRFKSGSDIMKTLATKSDLSVVMLDQASKADFKKLTALLLDEQGNPQFATKADMEPVLAVYRGSIFTKSLILGAAALLGAVVGIGWAVVTISSWIRGTPHI